MDNQPPSIQDLKQQFIEFNDSCDHRMLNCAAHMIINIESPKHVVQIGLEFLVSELSTCRADAGFATPQHDSYTPIAEFRNSLRNPLSIIGLNLPNQHPAMQSVWKSSTPVVINDVTTDENLFDLKKAFLEVGCKSMLLMKLLWEQQPIGIACIDYTNETHKWNDREISFMNSFCSTFLGPLAGISNYWFNPKMHTMFSKPTDSELAAIRLAANGLTYKQIADKLGKSTRTIENQFRNARSRLNAKNQIDLVKKCQHWL